MNEIKVLILFSDTVFMFMNQDQLFISYKCLQLCEENEEQL